MSTEQIFLLPLWYVVFLLSLTCHEAAHAGVSYLGGDPTAYHGGQVTLNPLPHIRRELFGTVLVPLLSYLYAGWMLGWASAPYDPFWEDRHPRRAAAMAAAGPLANLALALLGMAALWVGTRAGVWSVPYQPAVDRLVVPTPGAAAIMEPVGRLLSILLALNVLLFLFNFLPFPPMDGAAVLAGLVPPVRRLRDLLRSSPMGALLGLVVGWYVVGWIFWPILGYLVGFLVGTRGGLP